ncbi:MAG: D-alanyl-D-alanine carboxypeptidase family protein [Actinomycetota bacterium]|nr:D-alanyl-D-alanine carboxypeptidase family protein [Actinomycetota bacterium]
MSLIVVCLSVLLSIGIADFERDLSSVSAARMRAQTAADAAALAAAAESGPYGHGDAGREARSFAVANGATIVSCLCPTGATAAQVTVAVGDTTATARAVFDPTKLMPAAGGYDAHALDPRLSTAVARLLAAGHGRITFVSGYRSPAEQQQLWDAAISKYGDPETADNWVAPPGSSMHQRGLAVDLGGDLDLAARLVGQLRLPMWRPLDNEPWHFELTGSRR